MGAITRMRIVVFISKDRSSMDRLRLFNSLFPAAQTNRLIMYKKHKRYMYPWPASALDDVKADNMRSVPFPRTLYTVHRKRDPKHLLSGQRQRRLAT